MEKKVTTTVQFENLVQEMEKNPSLVKSFRNPSSKKIWKDISKKLNAFGPPERDSCGWQRVWRDLKFKVKKKRINNKGGRIKQLELSPMEEAVANLMQLSPDGLVCGVQDQGFSMTEGEEESRATSACSLLSSNVEFDEFLPIEKSFTRHQPGNNSASDQKWFMEGIEDVENSFAPESSNAINDRSKAPKKNQRLKKPNTLKPVSTPDKIEALNVLSKWVVEDCHPFSSVSGSGFKKMVEFFVKIGARYGECVDVDDMFPDDTTIVRKCQKEGDEKRAEEMELNELDVEELIRLVYSRPILWEKSNPNYYNAVLFEENWQSLAEALKQPKELCKKKWQNTCEQFGNELKKIPRSLSEKAELSDEEYDPYTAWPYFKSLLFLKNHMKARTPEGNCSLAEDFPDTSNEVNLDESFSESDEDIPDIEEAVARPFRKKPKANSDCAAEVLANEQHKLEWLKNEVSIQKDQRDDDNAFFDSLIPYMRTMDMHQNMLCRIELQKTVYNYSFPAATIMSEAPQNSTIQMDCVAEDSKMNIVDIKEEPKYL